MLFRALVPSPTIALPTLLTQPQLATAKDALAAAEDTSLIKTSFAEVLESIHDHPSPKLQREQRRELENINIIFRNELSKLSHRDPLERLLTHQGVMASGFYNRSLNFLAMPDEASRYPVHHFNGDMRRDSRLDHTINKYFISGKTDVYPRIDQLISELLLLERHLFASNRFFAVQNWQCLLLGVPFKELKTEEQLEAVMNHPIVKRDGNFEYKVIDLGDSAMWKQQSVKCLPEEGLPFYVMPSAHTKNKRTDFYETEHPKERIISRKERITNFLLRAWVMWLTAWGMFWAVDEEIITLAALLYAKLKAMRNLEKIAEESGGSKIYIAHKPNFFTAKRQFDVY